MRSRQQRRSTRRAKPAEGQPEPRFSKEFRARSAADPALFGNTPGQNGPALFSEVCVNGRCALPGCNCRWFSTPKFAPDMSHAVAAWGLYGVAAGLAAAENFVACDDCGTVYRKG